CRLWFEHGRDGQRRSACCGARAGCARERNQSIKRGAAMSKTAIILFGHGARDPQWARPMERVRDAVRAAAPGVEVEVAFLEFMQPGLVAAIDCLARGGATHVTVVPMFLAQGGHVKKDL